MTGGQVTRHSIVVFVGMFITMACGACEKDEPTTEGDALTRGAGADTTKNSGITLDTTWHGEYHHEF